MPQVNFGKVSISLKILEDDFYKLRDLKKNMKLSSYSAVIRECIRSEHAKQKS